MLILFYTALLNALIGCGNLYFSQILYLHIRPFVVFFPHGIPLIATFATTASVFNTGIKHRHPDEVLNSGEEYSLFQ
jgi:hypothetical protein